MTTDTQTLPTLRTATFTFVYRSELADAVGASVEEWDEHTFEPEDTFQVPDFYETFVSAEAFAREATEDVAALLTGADAVMLD